MLNWRNIVKNTEIPYVGDIGTKIYVDCIVSIASATNSKLLVRKPDKTTEEWDATVHNSHTLVHTATYGDFDQEGEYRVNAYVELSDGSWTGRVDKIHVHAKYF